MLAVLGCMLHDHHALLLLQMVGPLLAEEPKQLPTDLSNFLDQALSSEHPAVYVSLGTFVTPKEEELLSMVQGLSALPNPVLWKLDPQLLPGALQA